METETAEAIFDAASLLVVVLDRDSRILRFNAACERATGYRAREILGEPISILIPDDQLPQVLEVFHELRETGRSNLHENEWLTKSGERRQIAWSNTAIQGDDGAIARVIGTGIDVTDLRASEARAQESDSRLASIVHSAMDAIVSVDGQQRIVLFNPAAEQMFGHREESMLGGSLDELIPERFRAAHREHISRFAASGLTSRRMNRLGSVWGLRANGEEFPLEASIAQLQSADGPVLTVIARDISERQRLEHQLRQAQELAALATLVTGIAHDIGTPMNVILGYTDMLARTIRGEKDRERLDIIKTQVERVTRLIGTLMNFARPEREAPRSLRVEEILDRALGLIAETAHKRGITVERDFGANIGLVGQAERLERAFLDLFVNACDAMHAEGGVLHVVTRPSDDGVEIRIRDTGVGIAPDALERIFEPFYTTKPRGQGSGLGLLVTRSMVVEHGGTIEVQSEPEKGATFTIRLPCEGGNGEGGAEAARGTGAEGTDPEPLETMRPDPSSQEP
jgi:PAS domain S-box-containing protein